MQRSTTIIIAAIVVVAIAAGLGVYLTISNPGVKEFKLETWEYGYNVASGGPPLTVRAGQTVRVTLVNKGGIEHEFRIVKNRDTFISDVQKAIFKLPGKDQEDVEKAAEFKEGRRLQGMQIIKVDSELDWDIDVESGETKTIEFVISTPGTYWYVCGELDATFPHVHAERGMSGQIIVQP